ncbi:hypothetical protein NDU88_000089 [Pleurodeles waltl]|uniref:Uncharacterized protein n=1 Tax=Pleurodeles waltl TaxID=8319 RepID=A0AAV7TDZ2_PLEWA|nr:hypothetical protein NDU88_000089 [Pleurodeles waltl]
MSTVPVPMDSPRIQSTMKLPVAPEGPASDGSEDRCRYQRAEIKFKGKMIESKVHVSDGLPPTLEWSHQ